jgi:hypothetical protein
MNPDPAVMKSEEAARQSGPESQRTQSHDSAGLSGMQARRLDLGLALLDVVLWVAAAALWSGVFR